MATCHSPARHLLQLAHFFPRPRLDLEPPADGDAVFSKRAFRDHHVIFRTSFQLNYERIWIWINAQFELRILKLLMESLLLEELLRSVVLRGALVTGFTEVAEHRFHSLSA